MAKKINKKSTPAKKKTTKARPASKKAAKATPKSARASTAGQKTTTKASKKAAGKATRTTKKRATQRTTKTNKRSIAEKSSGKNTAAAHANPKASDKRKAPPKAVETVPVEPIPEPVPKTKLTDDQLNEFKQLLLHKRTELVGDVNHLRREALHENEESAGSSTLPIHMADVSTDRWEQEFTLGLMANERKLLREIDAALERIMDCTYGVCEATFKPISMRRLRAKPWARYCIEHARQIEMGRNR